MVGGGVAGLVAALECAKVGLRVTLLERRDAIGGCVGRIELDGLTLDSGAESFATRGGAVAELLEQLGLGDDIADAEPRRRLARDARTRRPARRRAPAAHGHAGDPREPARRRRAPHHRLGRGVARLPRPAQADPQDRPRPQPRPPRAIAHGRRRARSARRPHLGGRVLREPRRPRPRRRGARPQRGDDPHGLPLGRRRPAARGAQGRHRRARPARRHAPARRRARGAARPLRRRRRDRRRGHRARAPRRERPRRGCRARTGLAPRRRHGGGVRRRDPRPGDRRPVRGARGTRGRVAPAARRGLARLVGCLGLAARGIRGARDPGARRARARRRSPRHRACSSPRAPRASRRRR